MCRAFSAPALTGLGTQAFATLRPGLNMNRAVGPKTVCEYPVELSLNYRLELAFVPKRAERRAPALATLWRANRMAPGPAPAVLTNF